MIIKRGVAVAVRVIVEVVVGKAVISKSGVLVAVNVVVVDAVIVAVAVSVAVKVPVAVAVSVAVWVGEEVGGSAVGLTEYASLPTVISTPQTSGRVRVA